MPSHFSSVAGSLSVASSEPRSQAASMHSQSETVLARSQRWALASKTLISASFVTTPLAMAAMAFTPLSQGAMPTLCTLLTGASLALGAAALATNAKATQLKEHAQDLRDEIEAASFREQFLATRGEPLFGSQTFGKRLQTLRTQEASTSGALPPKTPSVGF